MKNEKNIHKFWIGLLGPRVETIKAEDVTEKDIKKLPYTV
jgi:hypothetical protein